METNNHQRIVDFTYCRYCVHLKKQESESPCDDCLDNPVNTDSRRPVYFKSTGLLERIARQKRSAK